jgi:bidirectional [NiFe] hydrogenase diaphorase subunit
MEAATNDAQPSGDKRFKILDTTLKRCQFQQDALIEVLHKAQEVFGCLEMDVLLYVARGLKLPPSRVYGVATFYHLFTLKPPGEHTCVVCMGTACFIKGAANLLAALQRRLCVPAGETRADGRASLRTARCLGASGLAPVAVFDGQTVGGLTPEACVARVKGWCDNGSR